MFVWPVSVGLSVVPAENSSWKCKRRVVFPEFPSAITLFILDKGTAWLSCQLGNKINVLTVHISVSQHHSNMLSNHEIIDSL